MLKKSALLFSFMLVTVPAFAASSTMSLTVDHGTSLTLGGAASSVFVANPDIADIQVMSPTQVMVFGKRTGETTFMASDSQGHTLAERTIVVSQDLTDLRQELDADIPGNKIHAKAVPNGIVLTGEAKDAAAVADAYKIAMRFMPTGGDIINRIQVNGSNQIQIRVRFAEVQRNIDNTLGFDWQNVLSVGGFVFGLGTGNMVSVPGTNTGPLSTVAPANGLFPRPNNTSVNLPNDVLGGSSVGSHVNVNAMIDALEQNGLITILAEPNLTAMSGETADFLAGGEFPVPIPQGNNTISITYKPYGVSLSFTPTLIGNNRINLHVRPEVSELTQVGAITIDNITVPAITTRKAETTVEVASGQSFAIAGLLDNTQAQTVNEFPGLGDIPILGALFRSDHFQSGQTELMVIITPYIVKPTSDKLALPTDGMAPPNETERLIGLRTTSGNPDARPQSGDPVAVLATPAAAPVTPVTSAPTLTTPMEDAPQTMSNVTIGTPAPTPPPESAPEPAPAVLTTPAPVPAKPASNTPALVLHPASDGKNHSGGILVE